MPTTLAPTAPQPAHSPTAAAAAQGHYPVPTAPPRTYSTETAARVLCVVPHTLRVSLCAKGEYYGLRPTKTPNRRLVWDADAVDALARGESASTMAPRRRAAA
jgi:hypothetical protein